jgi:hypothetical protein
LRNSETSTQTGVTPRSRTWASRRSETPAGITRFDGGRFQQERFRLGGVPLVE